MMMEKLATTKLPIHMKIEARQKYPESVCCRSRDLLWLCCVRIKIQMTSNCDWIDM